MGDDDFKFTSWVTEQANKDKPKRATPAYTSALLGSDLVQGRWGWWSPDRLKVMRHSPSFRVLNFEEYSKRKCER